MSTSEPPLLSVRGVRKAFPPATVALAGVDLALDAGEIHGLLGVNGAGKSTLIRILAGVERPDDGELRLAGRATPWFDAPRAAHAAGIGVVHQELPLLPNLTAAENTVLGLDRGRFHGRFRRRRVVAAYERVASALRGAPAADERLADLGPDRWQLVAVIRALASGARILVLDEPTSSLDERERDGLHAALRDVARLGVGVLYVSHFLDDVLDVCDAVTVLRDARVSMAQPATGLSPAELLGAMTGEDVAHAAREPEPPPRDGERAVVLELADVSVGPVGPVSLRVHAGERVGLYGLQDCGARELLEASFGLRPHVGACRLGGAALHGGPRRRIDAGLGYMPPARPQALIGDWSLAENLTLPALGAAPALAARARGAERCAGEAAVARFGIVGAADAKVRTLSGGNQQKVALARWVARGVRCLLADEPTRGVDVHGRTRLHELMFDLTKGDAGVLVFSTDPEEIAALCDRVLILERGRVTRELRGAEASVEALERLARVHAQPGAAW